MIKSCVLALTVLTSSLPLADTPEFRQAEVSKNISQFIRSNAVHYWSYVKDKANEPSLRSYTRHQGFVAGDPHMGNFAPIPLRATDGSRKMRFVNVDFDDAGYGSFFFDFARYVVTVEATDSKIKKGDLEEAYIKGLSGKKIQAPKEIQKFLSMSLKDYDQLAQEYVQKYSNSKGFVLEADKLDADNGKISRETLAAVFPGMKLIDVAIRPRERGGSEGTRLWILLQDAKAQRHIVELKPWEPSALKLYQAQPKLADWLKGVYDTFWPGLDASDYDLIEIKGAGLFWKRPKKVSLIDDLKDDSRTANLLAIFDANLLGLAHSKQAESTAYLAEIEKDKEAFHEAIEHAVEDYLDVVKRAYKKLK